MKFFARRIAYARYGMAKNVFLAGASGAIGRRLIPLLLDAGYIVHGLTRSAEKAEQLKRSGALPIIGDVYDAAALTASVAAAQPDIVVHQLTDLPQTIDAGLGNDQLERNARVRVEGTQNLVAAALTAHARQFVAQSLIASYANGAEPHSESDPIDAARGSIITLERLAIESPPLLGCALRFGRFYGPGTWYQKPDGGAPVHVDAAASATLLAIERRATGVFNVAEDRGYATSARARDELGWSADFRLCNGPNGR
jgi:nucleoside-diphosphate-sugar epimerase